MRKITVFLTGYTEGIRIDPETKNADIDYTKATNYNEIDLSGAYHLGVDRARDGTIRIVYVMGEQDGSGCIRTYFHS